MLSLRFRTTVKKNKKKKPLPCQTGYAVSINALLALYEQLKKRYNVPYLLTNHLNQDVLENFFALIRSFGNSSDHPTASQFRYRLRLALIGSQTRPPQRTNTEYSDENVSYLSAGLLKLKKLERVQTRN